MKYGITGFIVVALVIAIGMTFLNYVGQDQIQKIGKSAIENLKHK